MDSTSSRFDTRAIHAGEPCPEQGGAVVTPIYQTAMFEYGGESSYHDLRYIRLNNSPNHRVLDAKLASLEGGEAAVVAASGMAAISTALMALVQAGDHVLAQEGLYGGTQDFLREDLPACGVAVDSIDAWDPASWESRLRPETKLLYVESVANPLTGVCELEALSDFARAHGLTTLIDNTFPSPFNFRPLELGFDLVLHSATKYLNGHSDLVAGAVVGSAELVDRVRRKLNHLGGSLDPNACFLLTRGLKTLGLRMRQHNANALALAEFLVEHPRVRHVHYPGLASHPDHARAARLFDGFSGMLSLEVDGGVEAADRLISRLSLPRSAPSLGGVESLVTRPATTSHAGVPDDVRRAAGIGDALVRVSVGAEDTRDLLADFEQALG